MLILKYNANFQCLGPMPKRSWQHLLYEACPIHPDPDKYPTPIEREGRLGAI